MAFKTFPVKIIGGEKSGGGAMTFLVVVGLAVAAYFGIQWYNDQEKEKDKVKS